MLFAQKDGRESGNKGNAGRGSGTTKKSFNKEYWKDKECYNCDGTGHPSSHCPKDDANDDNKSQAKSVKKLTKDMKSMKKTFTQL
jgi:hypothetical protein